jgi:5-methyltetrahydrofolate--homocysteine methyltransferase
MEPVGSLTHALAVEMFHETADGLKAGGADIGWLETISAPEEYRAAAEGFALAGLEWCGTMSFDTAGRTMMGLTSEGMVEMVHALDNKPRGYGANCGTGASDLLRTVLGFAAKEYDLPIIAKGNAGIPKYVDGHIHYDGTPELMAQYAVMARNCGASVIGGCCGTMPAHLEKMREALDTIPKGSAPDLEEITAALGPFSSAGDGTGDDQTPKREPRRGGRRRS